MAYKIEENKIVFDTAPRAGDEIQVTVSTQQALNGFSDPRSFYPRRVNEVDTNRLAVNNITKQHPVVNYKRKRVDDLTEEPKTPYNAEYPYNHVKETESGHIQEFDDTPGYERIHEYHRSGTFYEVHPDGTRVTKIVGEDYEIVHQNKSVRVRGDCKVFIDGDSELYVRGSMNAQVDEDLSFNVGRNITFHAGKNIRMYSNESTEFTAQEEITATSVSNMKLQTQANLDVAADGNYKTSIKGDTDFIGDGYGVFQYNDDINLITDTIMDINAGTTMNITSNSAMDIVGSTIDLNKAARAAAAASSAEDIIFKDSRGSVSYTGGEEIELPLPAIVLPEKANVDLPDEGVFHADDDVDKTEAELRQGIKDGTALPSRFSEYSYNGLEDNYNTDSASRTILATPLIPSDTGDHGSSDGTNINISEAGAGNQSVTAVDQVTVTPAGGIDYSLQLSPSFTLGMISSRASFGHKIRPQHGLTSEQIINNLKNIAVNSLEPIKQKYPNMFVTSGFRPAKGTSQHERGMACDMQFRGAPKSEYHEIAVWIRENVPHDQLLLEYKNTGTGNPWIHLSLVPSGNRGLAMTFWNHRRYKDIGKFYNLA